MLSLAEMLRRMNSEIEQLKIKTGGNDKVSKEVENISLTQIKTAAKPLVDVSWDIPQGIVVTTYQVSYSYNGVDYTVAKNTTTAQSQIELPTYGETFIKVTASYGYRESIFGVAKINLRKMTNLQNEVTDFAIGQIGENMYFTVSGVLESDSPCNIELRIDGDNWDDANSVCMFHKFPYSFCSYIPAGEHLFRVRTNNDNIYGKKEKTFTLLVRDSLQQEVVIQREDALDPNFKIDTMMRYNNILHSPWSLFFEDIWEKNFDDIRYVTFESAENYDLSGGLNMATQTFDAVWDDTMDNKLLYNSYFEEPVKASEIISPVIDLDEVNVYTTKYDFKYDIISTNDDASIRIIKTVTPTIYIRYSLDNVIWSDWQIYLDASYSCRYLQYKLELEQLDNNQDVIIRSLQQQYSVGSFQDILSNVLNNIKIQVV